MLKLMEKNGIFPLSLCRRGRLEASLDRIGKIIIAGCAVVPIV